MRAAMDGDQAAYRSLLVSLAHALRSTVRRGFARAGLAADEVEDVVQETLLAVHLKRHTWRRDETIGPWITAIARNKLVDALRRRGRRAQVPIEEVVEELCEEHPDAELDRRDVDHVLGQLNGRQQDIVRWVSIEGYSIRQVAERLEMTEGAVRVALHRSLKSLAASLRRTPG